MKCLDIHISVFHLWNENNDKAFLWGLYFWKIYLKLVSKDRICFPPASSIMHPHPGLYYIILYYIGRSNYSRISSPRITGSFLQLVLFCYFLRTGCSGTPVTCLTPLPPGEWAPSDVSFHPWVILGAMVSPGGRSECWKNRPDHRPCGNAWGCDLRHLAG